MAVSIKGKGKAISRSRRHLRVRKKVAGTATRPRLVVSRSNRHMVAQLVDDTTGNTLVPATPAEVDMRASDGTKPDKARKVGQLTALRSKSAGIEAAVFDRGGNKYHGRVAAVADGARDGGLSL